MASSENSSLESWLARYRLTTCADLIHLIVEDLDDVRGMNEGDVMRMAAWLGMRSTMAKAKRLEDMCADIKGAGPQRVATRQASRSQAIVTRQASRLSRGVVRPPAQQPTRSTSQQPLRIVSRSNAPGDREEKDSDEESDVMTSLSQDDDTTIMEIESSEERDDSGDASIEEADQPKDDNVAQKWKDAAEQLRRENPTHPFRIVSLKRSSSKSVSGIVLQCLVPGCRSKNACSYLGGGSYVSTGPAPNNMTKYWKAHIAGSRHTTCLAAASKSRPPPAFKRHPSKRQRRG